MVQFREVFINQQTKTKMKLIKKDTHLIVIRFDSVAELKAEIQAVKERINNDSWNASKPYLHALKETLEKGQACHGLDTYELAS